MNQDGIDAAREKLGFTPELTIPTAAEAEDVA